MAVTDRPRKQEQERAGTDVTEVAPNVLRMQLPIQMPGLGHVNCYALIDERGAAIVDPGLPGPLTWKAIKDRFGKAGVKIRNVHSVIVTHSHPDHFGTAAKLAKEAGADVITHSAFHTWWAPSSACTCSDPAHDHSDDTIHDVDPEDLVDRRTWADPTPWGGDQVRPPLKRRVRFQVLKAIGRGWRLDPSIRVRHGERLRLAGRDFFAVHTPGHTLDHLCLHDPEERLLLSGDHVLPTITPHISGIGAGRDPLELFFSSLDRVAELDVETVLPAHGHPFTDLPGRTEAIKRHHRERLDTLRQASGELGLAPVSEYAKRLFREARWGPMADSETYAHLEHLRIAGEAERVEKDGLAHYAITGSPPAASPPSR